MTRNVEREHFLWRPGPASPGNVRERVAERTGVSGGWREGDATPHGTGPAGAARAAPAG
jgi:hypothetical protein